MSLNRIGIFQRDIYKNLKSNHDLSSLLSGIYITLQRDASYPYILINLVKSYNISFSERYSYEIEFEILLFTKSRNQESSLQIIDQIITLINPNMKLSKEYKIVALKFIEIEWQRGNDSDLTKLSLKYKGLIMGEICYG